MTANYFPPSALSALATYYASVDPLVTARMVNARTNGVLYVAHRGGANIVVEETVESYRMIVASGAKAIECDTFVGLDGSLLVMHDTTVDRTTTSTGNVANHAATSWKALTIDQGATFGGVFTSLTYRAPLLEEVLTEFGNKVFISIEAKNAGSGAPIVAMLQRLGISTDCVMIASFIFAELSAATAAGYFTEYLNTDKTAAQLQAAGINQITQDATVATAATFAPYLARGIRCGAYVVDRQYQRDAMLATGVTTIYSNDPTYVARTTPQVTTDPFITQTWYPGHGYDDQSTRGTFIAPASWGVADSAIQAFRGGFMGMFCPIKGLTGASNFIINFNLKCNATANATRWGGIYFSSNDRPYGDAVLTGLNGYNCLVRKSGSIEIFKVTEGVASSLATFAGTAFIDGQTIGLRLTVTPTSITFARTDTADTISTNDTTFRGGYFHLGRNGMNCEFSSVVVT